MADKDIRAFAQGVIDGQSAEIDKMKQWLTDLGAKRSLPALSLQKRRLQLLAHGN